MTSVSIEVDIDEFSDDDLLTEMEYRGYSISTFEPEELVYIQELVDSANPRVGSIGYHIREKLVKRQL